MMFAPFAPLTRRHRFVKTFKRQFNFGQVWMGLYRDDPDAKAVIRSYFRDVG